VAVLEEYPRLPKRSVRCRNADDRALNYRLVVEQRNLVIVFLIGF
jgi:hypothetical protein